MSEEYRAGRAEAMSWEEFEPLDGGSSYQAIGATLVRGFPYAIIYTVEPDEVVIVAVAHHERRPEFWLDRL